MEHITKNLFEIQNAQVSLSEISWTDQDTNIKLMTLNFKFRYLNRIRASTFVIIHH